MFGTLCSLALVGIVVFYSDVANTGLFALHPILMTLGFGALAFEAVWQISNKTSGFYDSELSRAAKVSRHRRLHYVAVTCIVVGFVIVAYGKMAVGKPHFESWHAKLGLVAVGLYTAQTIFAGFLMLRPPPNGVSFAVVRFAHASGGCMTLCIAGASLTLGLLTNFFNSAMNKAAVDVRPLLYTLLGCALAVTLWRSLFVHQKTGKEKTK